MNTKGMTQLETLQAAYGNRSGKVYNIVSKMQKQGVNAKMVNRLSQEEYRRLEFNVSSNQVERPASEDFLELMYLAVESDDKEWFKRLSRVYNRLIERENSLKKHLGML